MARFDGAEVYEQAQSSVATPTILLLLIDDLDSYVLEDARHGAVLPLRKPLRLSRLVILYEICGDFVAQSLREELH